MDLTWVNVFLGIVFLASACVAFLTMLHLLGAPHTPHAKALRIVHRVSGWATVVLYVIVAGICAARFPESDTGLSPRLAIHLTFGALFIPMILLKIIIVERYPELRNRLFTVGAVIFAIVFVLAFTSSMVRIVQGDELQVGKPAVTDYEEISLGRDLFVVKCAKCHRLDRPLSARKTADEWAQTVESMRQKDLTWMSEADAEKIAGFLAYWGLSR
jgi:hypothetical protein